MKRSRPLARRLMQYARAHWYGELPLGDSLWINLLLPTTLGSLALATLAAAMGIDGPLLRPVALAFAAAWPAALALDLWGVVGTWRSAGVRLGLRRRPLLPWAARAMAALVVVAAAALAWAQQGQVWVQALQIVVGRDPGGHAALARTPDGNRLQLHGPIGVGDAERLQPLLASPTPLRVLELDSSGGRYEEARRLAALVQQHGWHTRVTGECRNACVLVFRAGTQRQLMPQARLGFNRAGTEFPSPLARWLARRRLADGLAAAGLSPIFVLKAMSMPATLLWQPGADELLRGRFVSAPARPLDLELPLHAAATPGDHAAALRASPLWNRIDARFPGTQDTALQQLLAARGSGADADALQVAAQRVLEPLLGQLLYNAGPDLREPYARLLLEQIAAVPEPNACRDLLEGDAAVRRSLPAALAVREADWLLDALIEPLRTAPPKRGSSAEHEVIRRRLGGHAPAALGRLRRPAGGDNRACERAATLLGQMLELPLAERKLALRLAFETP